MKTRKFSWKVLHFNCNTNTIETYDVLKHAEKFIKKMKKTCASKQEFSEMLDREMMYHYWSRAEYELILEREDNQLYLKPWCGSRNPEEAMVIATDYDTLDWIAFSKWNKVNWWGDEVKIDVYDQLKFRWNEFVDYCWNTRLPYERRRKDVQ